MKKTITLARNAGFCHGVKRAVEGTKQIKSASAQKNVYVMGELIHNSDVINELEKSGIKTLNEIPQKYGNCDICIIRSHGLAQTEIDKIAENGYEIVDFTCPDVKKVQQKAVELAGEGYLVVIVGKSEHPEVMAIMANAKQVSENVVVISDVKEIDEALIQKIKSAKKVGIVSQTTQRIQNLQEIVSEITALSKEIRVFNTICASTTLRQNAARELAKESDLMVVVGSKKSANTTHLAEILKNITKTIHIENENELGKYKDIIDQSQKIGVTAGASTPNNIIETVIKELEK